MQLPDYALEAIIYDVNETGTIVSMSEIIANSKTRFGDAPSSLAKINLSHGRRRVLALTLNMNSLLPSNATTPIYQAFVKINITAVKDDATPLSQLGSSNVSLAQNQGVFANLVDEKDGITFANIQNKDTSHQFITGLGGTWEGEMKIADLAPIFATSLTKYRSPAPQPPSPLPSVSSGKMK
mmetsp:Transcript_27408/g.37587  ORF Transcript_27408/g.37587 Transcript_27408/m.37587 type:complete len:182 (-) Transcript_27408:157-702(-)|eukprot:CAMPEP_0185743482 /NCGR_PEP_ID=MMETSP1174-20130828/1251_1 /TAXON_ID=35687 /ORGANISM="Dictyocha speculum, Strain CCMP1381" /LENGTH=181 /DNA_ID=CAMNT_0028416213 /DNA_START=245 /DNA_END=790 /DNA_ORIENTATION=-